jgi:hypothetical protein
LFFDPQYHLLSVVFIGGKPEKYKYIQEHKYSPRGSGAAKSPHGFGENLNLGARIGPDFSIFYLVSYLIFLLEKVWKKSCKVVAFLGFFCCASCISFIQW